MGPCEAFRAHVVLAERLQNLHAFDSVVLTRGGVVEPLNREGSFADNLSSHLGTFAFHVLVHEEFLERVEDHRDDWLDGVLLFVQTESFCDFVCLGGVVFVEGLGRWGLGQGLFDSS